MIITLAIIIIAMIITPALQRLTQPCPLFRTSFVPPDQTNPNAVQHVQTLAMRAQMF